MFYADPSLIERMTTFMHSASISPAANLSVFRRLTKEMRLKFSACVPSLAIVLALGAVAASAHAQTLSVLYRFTGGADGENPVAGVVRDSAGNLYGTTGCNYCVSGYGSVFKIDKDGNETTLHSFTGGSDGQNPDASLIRDAAGNLYGSAAGGVYRSGTIFKIDATGNLTTLYSFGAFANDGELPFAELIRDAEGNLYGTTPFGGAYQQGTVFKVDTSGNETQLHSFSGADGALPFGGLVRDSAQNLYGTTYEGGTSNNGTVFMLNGSGTETVLHSLFAGHPSATLLLNAGYLYGTSSDGGNKKSGVVFKISPTNKKGDILHNFTGAPDGGEPTAGLVRDAGGNFYGTTFVGGTSGAGTIFKVDAAGGETILYSFTGGTDGGNPESRLVMDSSGNLYGTTYLGGATTTCFAPNGCGVVFKFAPK
jgi:uncharacterized repeat protein (TIGR03803 family)